MDPTLTEPRAADTTRPRRARLVAFRFLFLYLILYSFPFPLTDLPYVKEVASQAWQAVWFPFVKGFGSGVIRLSEPITVLPNGSGDTTFNWVELSCFAAVSALGAFVWTLLDRRAAHLDRWRALLRVQVRYVLAFAMLEYGTVKIFQLQFSPPSEDRLMTSYGDSSPMGLLWTFMGSSAAYSLFAGVVESLGGVLLLARRTTTLGALVSAAAMTNVVVLNFCFDVPVKIYSSHLLAMALCLIAPEARRLFAAIALGRAVGAAPRVTPLTSIRGRRAAVALKILFVGAFAWGQVAEIRSDLALDESGEASSIAGLWSVEEFRRDGVSRPLLCTDATLWRRISISRWGTLTIRRMNDASERFLIESDEQKHVLAVRPFGRPDAEPVSYAWSHPEPEVLAIEGTEPAGAFQVRLRRAPANSFFLTSRGFHWVNEIPLNR